MDSPVFKLKRPLVQHRELKLFLNFHKIVGYCGTAVES